MNLNRITKIYSLESGWIVIILIKNDMKETILGQGGEYE